MFSEFKENRSRQSSVISFAAIDVSVINKHEGQGQGSMQKPEEPI
jgi:hypothetical protein